DKLYSVAPRGTMIVTLPPSVWTVTFCGTLANSIWMLPPLVLAVTRAAVSAVPLMLPPSVLRVRLPAVWLAARLPPPEDTVTAPVVPVIVALPPSVETETAVAAGTLRVESRLQLPIAVRQL